MTMNPPLPTLPVPAQTPRPRGAAYPATIYNPQVEPPTEYRKFSIEEYHRLTEIGFFDEDDNIELLEGYLVHKMAKNPPHESTNDRLIRTLARMLPDDWQLRNQGSATINDSEPEPDFVIMKGDDNTYSNRHPEPADIAFLIEVADSSVPRDRGWKQRIYARAGVQEYWIVNLVERQIEVYTDPTGPVSEPVYRIRKDYLPGSSVPVVLEGNVIGSIPVDKVLP
jgi:Uma2 family endonuclease